VIGVTADTNIYVSALIFGGIPRQFLIAARERKFQLDISSPIIAEIQRILVTKFSWTPEILQTEMRRLSEITTLASPTRTITAVPRDPDDDKFIECAVAAGSNYIVSGDGDLLSLGRFEGIQIVRVADFMAMINP